MKEWTLIKAHLNSLNNHSLVQMNVMCVGDAVDHRTFFTVPCFYLRHLYIRLMVALGLISGFLHPSIFCTTHPVQCHGVRSLSQKVVPEEPETLRSRTAIADLRQQ